LKRTDAAVFQKNKISICSECHFEQKDIVDGNSPDRNRIAQNFHSFPLRFTFGRGSVLVME
jgi:hypothetical protein